MSRKRIVIVGAGFAGLNAAKALGRCRDADVTVIDRRNHHLFQPLLYQVAMAGLDPSEIASPIRSMLHRYKNIRTLLGAVTDIDTQRQLVTTESGAVPYDYLIVACGAQHSYFGNDHWEQFAPGLKNIPQATEIRRRVLIAFDEADRTHERAQQDHYLTFVVVGGGPTGVELAGAIAEMARFTLKRDFRTIDATCARVILVQGGDRVLKQFPDKLSAYGRDALESMGVDVRLGDRVTDINAEGVKVGKDFIAAKTVIWAAGVQASVLGGKLGVPLDRCGQVIVGPDLSIPESPNVFVVGDQAAAKSEDGNMLPGLAPVAIQQGRYVGKLIRDEIRRQKDSTSQHRKPFRYYDKGQMATIGRRRAVAQSGKMQLTGTLAWLAWLFIHIVYLSGFRNRFFVFLTWSWSYITFSRGARLIVPRRWRITEYNE